MAEFSQARAFNLGVAQETSIEAALIYDDLVYAQKVFGKGYFFRSDEQMLKRFPIFSKSTVRRHVKLLVDAGYISTKVRRVNTKPVLHYQIEKFLNVQIEQNGIVKLNKTNEIVKLNIPLLETKKETKSTDPVSFGADDIEHDGRTGAPALPLLHQIIEIVNPKEKPTAERLRALNARLKDYSGDDIIGAAYAFSKSEWHRENKQMSIDNLIAPSKFGRWFAQKPDTNPVQAKSQLEADIAEEERLAEEFRRGNK